MLELGPGALLVGAIAVALATGCHRVSAHPKAPCPTTASSTLNGVAIEVPSQRCTYTLAQAKAGVTFHYVVDVTRPVSGVVPKASDAGHCQRPGKSGLITAASISGHGQKYCLCDMGLCGPPSRQPVTLTKGHYAASFHWDGRNWGGPSDTVRPHGKPFPPGRYTFEVIARGTRAGAAFEVRGALTFSLVK